jgi:hypothetical protein
MAVTVDASARSNPSLAPAGSLPARGWRDRLPGRRTLRDGRYLIWWAELLVMVVLYVSYESIRDLVSTGGKFDAFNHALQVINLQKALGINHELQIQQWVMHAKVVIIASNYFYGSMYALAVLVWLYRKHSDVYPFWRNALLCLTLLGLIGFFFYPLMPPRLLPTMRGNASFQFKDTLAMYPAFWSFNGGPMKDVSNQYAAMPSLHCGWALWCTCAIMGRLRTTAAKALAVAYTVATVFVVVVTGNHYFVDAIAGFICLTIGYVVARLVTKAGRGAPTVDLAAGAPTAA